MKDRSAHGGGSLEAPRTEATAAQGEEQGEPEAEMEEMGETEHGAMEDYGGMSLSFSFLFFVPGGDVVSLFLGLFCFCFRRLWGEGDVVRPPL